MLACACDPGKLRPKDHHEFKGSLLMIPGQCKLEHHARKEKGAGYQLGSYTEIHFGFVCHSLVSTWHTIYFFNVRTYIILANTQPVSNEKYVEAPTSPNLCFTLGYFPISLSWNTVSYNSPHQFKDCLFNCVSFIISLIHCVFTSITTNFNV